MNLSPRFLLIDENLNDSVLTLRLLEEEFANLQVKQLSNAEDFYQVLEEFDFDLVVTECRLGEIEGRQILKAVKNRYPNSPAIVFTGSGSEVIAVEVMKAGADDYIIKSPNCNSGLTKAVRSALEDSKQQRAEQEAESVYRSLFDRVPVGLYRTAPCGQILDANPAMVQMLGYPNRETLLAVNAGNFLINTKTLGRWQVLMEREGIVRDFEAQVRRYDGTQIWIKNSVRAVKDPQEQLLYYEGSIEDVTSRVQAQDALKLSEQRFRLAIQHSPIVVFNQDQNLRYTWIDNPQMGYSVGEFLGQTDIDLFAPPDGQRLHEMKRQVVETGIGLREEVRASLLNGQAFYYDLIVEPLRDYHGKIVGITGAAMEITQRKQVAEEREQLLQEIDQQRRLFQMVVDNVPAGIAVLDGKDLRVKWANQTYGQFLEEPFCSADITGVRLQDYLPGSEENGLADIFRRTAATGEAHIDPEYEMVGFARGVTYWRWSLLPLFSSGQVNPDLMVLAIEITEQVLARKQLEELAIQTEANLAQLQAILIGMTDGLVIADLNGKVLDMNPAALQLHGFARLEECLQHLHEFDQIFEVRDLEGKTLPVEEWPLGRVVRGETFSKLEVQVRHKDTDSVWIASYAGTQVRNYAGESILAILTVRDITTQKQIEAERSRLLSEQRRQREFLETLVENAPIGIAAVKGADHRYILANPTYNAIPGVVNRSVVGQTVAEVFPLSAARSAGVFIEDVYRTGKSVIVRNYQVCAGSGGKQTYWNIDHVPLFGLEDQVDCVLILAQEVTETVLIQRRLAFLSDASALLAASLDCEFTLANVARLAVLHLADWCEVDLLDENQSIRRVAMVHQNPDKEQLLQDYASDLQATLGVAQVLSTGKARIWAEATDWACQPEISEAGRALPIEQLSIKSAMCVPLTARGRTLGAICFVSAESGRQYGTAELTLAEELGRRAAFAVDNARLYREAEEANRMKDEFLATLSHELRTPLSAIFGWARLLRGGQLDAATSARAFEAIERNARAQTQLIEDLLDVSRIIRGQLQLNVEPVNLATVIAAATDAVLLAAEAKGIELSSAIDPRVEIFFGDPDRLQQVVWNLLSNAIKFTPRGGRVRVMLECTADSRTGRPYVQIQVSDTGKGIPPAFLPFVFERFRQADSTSIRLHGGLGLGLAIVRHLVELHGGTVSVDSAGEGEGATFTVQLPLMGSYGAAEVSKTGNWGSEGDNECQVPLTASPASEAPLPLDGLRALVVDDEADALEVVTAALEQYGAQVSAVSSAGEALVEIERLWPDILISDIAMPRQDGYALIQKVRVLEEERALKGEEIASVPAVALTAYAREQDRQQALSAGYQIHLAKPIEPAKLVAIVAQLTGRTL
ncbi:PAS domain-containing protein [Microcoleus sp. FACHB-68]|uniref:PAS domain-containing protein n=1 Tax=Microcoleus sp. FACHB-68 TaxID=2692826 RepID=UPI001687DA99|nr:PAS domain-containing protein [Microcoleus sp. FACHB-68]MBD1937094.1 PAS domain-containing protein [Microcoleus sp. FACHB-68]